MIMQSSKTIADEMFAKFISAPIFIWYSCLYQAIADIGLELMQMAP